MNDLEFWLTDTSTPAPPPSSTVAPQKEVKSPSKDEEVEGGRRKGRKSGKARKVRRVIAKHIVLLFCAPSPQHQ